MGVCVCVHARACAGARAHLRLSERETTKEQEWDKGRGNQTRERARKQERASKRDCVCAYEKETTKRRLKAAGSRQSSDRMAGSVIPMSSPMRDMTHSYVWRDWFLWAAVRVTWSVICATWLLHMRYVTHSYRRIEWREVSFPWAALNVTWFIHMCDVTQSCEQA